MATPTPVPSPTPSPGDVVRVAELGPHSMFVLIALGCVLALLLVAVLVRGLR